MQVETVDARSIRFEHADLSIITRSALAERVLDLSTIEQGRQGVLFIDGKYVETLSPGRYAFWKNTAQVKTVTVDVRETMIDVVGQDIMTNDKVTLRMNAVATSRFVDPRQAVSTVDDVKQALYREVQLALRAVVGARELDALLADKDVVAREVEEQVRKRVG